MTFPITGKTKLTQNTPGNYINVNEAVEAGEYIGHGWLTIGASAGGTITITSTQDLQAKFFRFVGSTGSQWVVDFPDGNRERTVVNETNVSCAVDTVTGASTTLQKVNSGAGKTFVFRGVDIRLSQTWTIVT